MFKKTQDADVCLILEGTYPFVLGGVSSWVHDLIAAQSHLKFTLICLTPPKTKIKLQYELPSNVVGIEVVPLQTLRPGTRNLSSSRKKKLFETLEYPLLSLLSQGKLKDLESVLEILNSESNLGARVLLNSEEAWNMLLRMYHTVMGDNCFLDYFWSWRSLLGSLYSILFCDIPKAKVYHALCTGYAGLMLSRIKLETSKPCFLTEHGIYTNERRIEIILSDWLQDQKSMNLTVDKNKFHKDLKDFWIESFVSYSQICYQIANPIITLYEGNKTLQLADGAEHKKLHVIPNGIDWSTLSKLKRDTNHPPTVALIGRVVPIKDVKTYIRSINQLRSAIPNIRAWVMGPTTEDEDYYNECLDMVKRLNLEESVIFTGKVDIKQYLSQVDVMVLTSISEAQPLTLLEAGAAGIPSVATNVGACKEMLYGRSDELATEPLGQGGIVCPLSSPTKIADALYQLLTDGEFHEQCGKTMKERVRRYYDKKLLDQTYKRVYDYLMKEGQTAPAEQKKAS